MIEAKDAAFTKEAKDRPEDEAKMDEDKAKTDDNVVEEMAVE